MKAKTKSTTKSAIKRTSRVGIKIKPRANSTHPSEPTGEEIAALAYLIWEKEGHSHGRDVEHWNQALAQLKHTRKSR